MADPEVNHDLAYNAQGEINILRSPFYEPDWEYDDLVESYVNRIIYCLAETIEILQPRAPWLLIVRAPLSPPPVTAPLTKVFDAIFLVLLDTCLKSSYLPAYLAAAFIKKLSRLALSVPPSGELIIIALIHNLLRRHPSINFLVQQQVDDLVNGDASAEGDDFEEYVMKSNADPAVQRSSLWEIDTLRHHYCPAVSRFVASLENDLTVRAKTSEMAISDFSSGSYATIFREEVRRRIKQCPVAFYRETPTCLFNESDFPGWSFGDHQQVGVEENGNGVDRVVGKITLESEDRDVKRLRIESY
ncbi:hypothetical protein MA16_Dca014622 [Dendrobium catenatum]|uniref:CCAAT-binding factor domain-containing protein n=1 Tax=Dendrobium catenatum TaxID=906689 RepID=A0A2I0WYP5_9ASPA|nr:hypothetical protein MA16_Dca014622 [Dendrobium catenatum]